MAAEILDLGHGHTLQWCGWFPDRDLNPQYADLPDVEKFCVIVAHPNLKKPGETCRSAADIDGEVQRALGQAGHCWTVESWEPLTLSPSLLCTQCGDHGFIRQGRWVPA